MMTKKISFANIKAKRVLNSMIINCLKLFAISLRRLTIKNSII
jgi:hypothetical protein